MSTSSYHKNSLDELAKANRPTELLTEVKKITFKIIMHIFLGSEVGPMMKTLEEEYANLNSYAYIYVYKISLSTQNLALPLIVWRRILGEFRFLIS